jgi:hypothetical protein
MRGALLSILLVLIVVASAPSNHPALSASATISATASSELQVPDKKIEITVGERSSDARWYRSPVWIAIGFLAAIVILLLILISRSGGTTIIRS